MSADAVPTTLVKEIMVAVQDTLRLDARDGPKEAMDKGLYGAPAGQPVVVYDGDAARAVISASELRGSVLTRSWSAPLGDRLTRLTPPPETTAKTPAVDLLFLAQANPEIEWLTIVDEKTGKLVGVLNVRQVRALAPPIDAQTEFYGGQGVRGDASMRLYGVASVQNVYYTCEVENRVYGPNAVHPDASGQMRDRQGHLVEEHKWTGR